MTDEDWDWQEEDERLSYAEIYSTLLLNDEIVITIPAETEERVKLGLKNLKAKTAIKHKEEGKPIDNAVLAYSSTPSKDFEGAVDLRITLNRKAVVKVLKLSIPDKEF